MLDFDAEVVEFKLKGKEYSVARPTNGQIKAYTKELSLCETDEAKEKALIKFLCELGLSEEVLNDLTPFQTKKLLSSLYESEKN